MYRHNAIRNVSTAMWKGSSEYATSHHLRMDEGAPFTKASIASKSIAIELIEPAVD